MDSMDPVDYSSMVVTLMLYSCFSKESSRSMSGLLEFSSTEEHPGSCFPLPWSLCFLQACACPHHFLHLRPSPQVNTRGVLRHCCSQMDQRAHIAKQSGYEAGSKSSFWGFESLTLITCTSQVQELIQNDILWLGLMLSGYYEVLVINWEKQAGFKHCFSHPVVDI